jgi:hypothetical protein
MGKERPITTLNHQNMPPFALARVGIEEEGVGVGGGGGDDNNDVNF